MATSTDNREPEDPRVRFAAERTVLAWIRTGLAMMGFGFVVARFGVFLRELANTAPAGPAGYAPRDRDGGRGSCRVASTNGLRIDWPYRPGQASLRPPATAINP